MNTWAETPRNYETITDNTPPRNYGTTPGKTPLRSYEPTPSKTLPSTKKPPVFQRDRVRYVKDPLAETKYAYHINYHGDETSDDPEATNALPSNGAIPQDEHSLQRAANQSRRVGFVGDDGVFVMAPPPGTNHYMNDTQRVGSGDGSMTIPYDPASYAEGFDDERDKESRKRRKCSIPPWWAWLIIILVTCLLVAVLYFIFGKLFKKSSENGAMPVVSDLFMNGSSTKQPDLVGLSTTVASSTESSLIDYSIKNDPLRLFMLSENTRSLQNLSQADRPLSQAQSLEACLDACLDASLPCYGVDFDEGDKTCHLITRFDYALDTLGSAPGKHNYRRTFESKSFCHGTPTYNLHNTFKSSVSYKTLPSDIDTLAKCQEACFGSHGNGVLENGYRCTAGVFTASGECLITDVRYDPVTIRTSQGSTHFINDGVKCVDGNKTACTIQFTVNTDQQPVDLLTSLALPEALSVPHCADRCVEYLSPDGQPCTGFVYNYPFKVCTLYTGQRTSASFEEAKDSDFYGRLTSECDGCGYVRHPGMSGSGDRYPVTSRTRRACAERCSSWSVGSDACHGFDLTNRTGTSDVKCMLLAEAGYRLTASSGTENYAYDPACKDCQSTEFISTLNTAPTGGSPVGRTSLAKCSRACQEAVSSWVEDRRCYGFTFNTVTNNCTLFYDFEYELNNIGTDAGSVHYRRTFICANATSSCNTYEVTPNTKGSSRGLLQPWDINTVPRCQDRCWGYGLTSNLTCHGLDYDRRTSRCVIYLDEDYMVGQEGNAPGVDHYVRNTC